LSGGGLLVRARHGGAAADDRGTADHDDGDELDHGDHGDRRRCGRAGRALGLRRRLGHLRVRANRLGAGNGPVPQSSLHEARADG
jgi:hypothetical protein